MTEAKSLKERMEALGWGFLCDFTNEGKFFAAAYKRGTTPMPWVGTHFRTDQDSNKQFKTDLAACMAAVDAEGGCL